MAPLSQIHEYYLHQEKTKNKKQPDTKLSYHLNEVRFFFFCLFVCFFGTPVGYEIPGLGIRLKPQLQQGWISHALCGAGDKTCVPALPRHRQFLGTIAGTLRFLNDFWSCNYIHSINLFSWRFLQFTITEDSHFWEFFCFWKTEWLFSNFVEYFIFPYQSDTLCII